MATISNQEGVFTCLHNLIDLGFSVFQRKLLDLRKDLLGQVVVPSQLKLNKMLKIFAFHFQVALVCDRGSAAIVPMQFNHV